MVRDHPHTATLTALVLAVGVGLLCGIGNGILVAIARIPAIVATLGTLSVIRMMVFLIGGNQQISADEIPNRIQHIATTSPFHFPWIDISALVVFSAGWFYLSRTRSGRYFYAVGSNPDAAAARGLPVRRTVIGAFALSGAIAGLAGFMYLARFGTVEPGTSAIGYELFAITAVVVGGTSILGGTGGLVHSFFGVLLIGVMSNGLTISGLSDAWQTIAQGAIILLAILADTAIRARALARRDLARRRFG
jgi:rhamnose transport system permease protein